MKRKILLASVCILLIGGGYLLYLNKRIEGVWVVNYFSDDYSKSWKSYGASVWNIEGQHISTYSFGGFIEESSGSYFDIGTNFIWNLGYKSDGIDYKIDGVEEDSLILQMSGLVDREVVLRKISDTLKNNSDLKKKLLGKFFKCKISGSINLSRLSHYPQSSDTLYFDVGYIKHKSRIGKNSGWSSIKWEWAKIEGFDIIFAEKWATLILRDDNKKIEFHGFDINGRSFKYELDEIEMDISELTEKVILK